MQRAHTDVCRGEGGGGETKVPCGPWAEKEGPKKHF